MNGVLVLSTEARSFWMNLRAEHLFINGWLSQSNALAALCILQTEVVQLQYGLGLHDCKSNFVLSR